MLLMPSPSASNVVVEGGTGTLDDLIKGTPRGLLVTSMLGHSPNGITGEYSRGASGFWIEDGAIAYPVEELTVEVESAAEFQRTWERYVMQLEFRAE